MKQPAAKKIVWRTERRKVSGLIPFKGNPRKASEKETADLDKSLAKFNLAEPLVINTTNEVIGGNFRLKLLREKGVNETDVRVPDRKLSKREAEELNLRLNKNQASWDLGLLSHFSEDLLEAVGWDRDELDEIYGVAEPDKFDFEKEFRKAVEKPKHAKTGDLWQLGEHKLLIGDCTKKENWRRLLGGERYDFLFTDPPYKIGANMGDTKAGVNKHGFKVKRKGGFGCKGLREYKGLKERGGVPPYDAWLSLADEFQNPKGANVMVFEYWKNTPELWRALEKYWPIRNQVIWHLLNRSQGFSADHRFFSKYDIAPLAGDGVSNEGYEKELEDYLRAKGQKLLDTYEVCLYGQKGQSAWDKKKQTRWAKVSDHVTWSAETGKSSGQGLIFGTKPAQILVPYVKVLSPRDGIVMEPFGGSGSTLIACEVMKRKCRAMEVEPSYAEVIIARFERFSGIKAVRINQGLPEQPR